MSGETWTVEQCAQDWGITPSSWRVYVGAGRAPKPLPGYDEQRRRRWDPDEVRRAKAARPGRGARTDLGRERRESAEPPGAATAG